MYLTRRQREILDFITEQIEGNGYAPSMEEIGARFGLTSTATVHKHLSNLEQKGYIRRSSGRSRAIELRGPEGSVEGEVVGGALAVPLLGRIAAGRPIEALSVPEQIELPASLVGRHETFVLQVAGDSMIGEQIRDGDYVVVERRETAREGQIVVALIGEDATLKRFYHEPDGSVRLQPANPAFSPIILRQGQFRVQGVVTAMLRKY